jgi:hypothetical protein
MLKSDCAHLKRVTNDDIHERNRGSLRCDVGRAAPDSTSRAGISCPDGCMGYRPVSASATDESSSAFSVIKRAFMALIGKD